MLLKQLLAFTFLYCLLQGQQALAFDNAATEQELLRDILPSSCDFTARFEQSKQVKGIPLPLKSNGEFLYSCRLGLIWNTVYPFYETLLISNRKHSFRMDEDGELLPLQGAVQFGMSRVFMRLLKGDIDYFADEFSVQKALDNNATRLTPESKFMKKGLAFIDVQKTEREETGVSLTIEIQDVMGQVSIIDIHKISEATNVDSRLQAYEYCQTVYKATPKWCRILRTPAEFDR